MVLPRRVLSKICVTQLDSAPVYAQFISMVCFQNSETSRRALLHEKVVVDLFLYSLKRLANYENSKAYWLGAIHGGKELIFSEFLLSVAFTIKDKVFLS